MRVDPDKRAKAPLVTVVLISYNHAEYLRCCLDSINEQSYVDIQCVIVDNASTDNSRAVIEDFVENAGTQGQGRNFEVIFSPENLHLTRAMIAGFRRAKGSYIAFVDGDDYFLPTCLEMHVAAHLVTRVPVGATAVDMYQSRDTDLVTGTGKTFSEFIMSGTGHAASFCRMENLNDVVLSRDGGRCRLEAKDLHLVPRQSGAKWPWSPTSGLCFRREGVELMFSYEPKIFAGTDAYLVRAISALTGSITIDRPLAVYRQHSSNMFTTHPSLANLDSHEKSKLAASDVEVSEQIFECFKMQATALVGRLEYVDSFIESVDMLARVGPGLAPGAGASSYVMGFLMDNRALLERAAGKRIFTRWVRRYARNIKERAFLVSCFFSTYVLRSA